jgi:2-isopropylmalate synthase
MLEILDSTLRDGAQGENVNFSAADKIAVIKTLAAFGIPFIEAGNPGSNPKDAETFEKASKLALNGSKLVAFGATRRKHTRPEEDKLFSALINAPTDIVSIFGKASLFQATEILGVTKEENLSMIADSISFAVKAGKTVFFDAEHFFDGYKQNADYALTVLKTAAEAGAKRLVLCDTNGGSFPDEIYEITKTVVGLDLTAVGIHCHNDLGCAEANVYAAVRAGANHIQGTFTGFGERCGNTNLSVVIPALQLHRGLKSVPDENLPLLTETARKIAEIANVRLSDGMPFVGTSAFAHKGGMHTDGVRKNPSSFEHINPAAVGNDRSIILSEVAGRAALLSKINAVIEDGNFSKDSPEVADILDTVKKREHEGYQYEGADASFEILVRQKLGLMPVYFEIDYYKISADKYIDYEPLTSVTIKAHVGDKTKIRAHEGDGPVNAIDKALRKALSQFYPVLDAVRLTDYKVRIMDSKKATGADVRVLIESTDGTDVWTTVGASTNIINASVFALIDSITYKLLLEDKKSAHGS